MSKYNPLFQYLLSQNQQEMRLPFSKIEDILGCPLPPSAYKYPMWWENGGHTQAKAWLDAGYYATSPNLAEQVVIFRKRTGGKYSSPKCAKVAKKDTPASIQNSFEENRIIIFGHTFRFIQCLIPERRNGEVVEDFPQRRYPNPNNLYLNKNGKGAFCKFSIEACPCPGVYLWVVGKKIIYIGQTENLQNRFNSGYGNISPRNCYEKGQSTNCKMNKVVMQYYKHGIPIRLYFLETNNYKQIERDLLENISTLYNERM